MTKEKVIDILKGIKDGTVCLMPNMPEDGKKAIDIAIKAVEQSGQHWIPVTKRLPDNSRNVLITSRGGVSMAWYNGSYFEKGANTHHRKMQTVTAWCELPEPFKGVTYGND